MIARVTLVAVTVFLCGTGVAFCGVAIYLSLCLIASAPAAAALTALILFLLAAACATIYLARFPNHSIAPPPAAQTADSQGALVSVLAQLAKEHPFLAVGYAAALGMTDAMNRKVR
ncbi:MAG: hypothetical protein SGJ03_06415 [Alphaproteobacteria bacterium]|nr:hypothetical protein [Alphaproteobacteria bacterium]